MNSTVKIVIGALFVVLIAVGVWSVSKIAPTAQLTGTASYSDKIDLPAGSTVEVSLIDITNPNADSLVLAKQVIVTKGEGSPFPFALTYNPSAIKAVGDYSVGARVRVNGSVWWTSTSNLLVLTKGHATSSVDVKLVNVR
ncbi:MAG: YbaY family lipoprotein [Candidatus Paceibacterota bacterium]|jgi:putative lipoprotein